MWGNMLPLVIDTDTRITDLPVALQTLAIERRREVHQHEVEVRTVWVMACGCARQRLLSCNVEIIRTHRVVVALLGVVGLGVVALETHVGIAVDQQRSVVGTVGGVTPDAEGTLVRGLLIGCGDLHAMTLVAHRVVLGGDETRIIGSVRIVTIAAVELDRANRVVARLEEVLADVRVTGVAHSGLFADEQREVIRAMRLVASRAVIVEERVVLHRLKAERCDTRMACEAEVSLIRHQDTLVLRRVRIVAVEAEPTFNRRVYLLASELRPDRVTCDAQVALVLSK